MVFRWCLAVLLASTASLTLAQEKPETPPAAQTAPPNAAGLDRDALEKAFSEKLSGSVLVGTYSFDGQNTGKPPRPERYEIDSVTKLRDDYWTFVTRIKYGEHDVKVPITLKVLWAGDTPVITLTDFTIPGLGTFTARVLFYGDRYVGTWQHGKAGGHMWGNIEAGATENTEPEIGKASPESP